MKTCEHPEIEIGEVYAYLMNKDGTYDKPIVVNSTAKFEEVVYGNIEKVYEIRVVDKDDCIVFQVIDKTLVFPIPDFGAPNNVWNSQNKQFETVTGTC